MQYLLHFGATDLTDIRHAVLIRRGESDVTLYVHMRDGKMHTCSGPEAIRDAEILRYAGITVLG